VELEEPALPAAPAEPAEPELGELIDPELGVPLLEDPLCVLIDDVVLLCEPVAGWLCAYASDAPQRRIAVLAAASPRYLIAIMSSRRATGTARP
jgi:hypothetical protein